MNPAEIVVHVVKCHMVGMVLNLLGEGICEARKSAYLHPHRKVLALDVTRRNVLWVALPHDGFVFAARAFSRTVACFLLRGFVKLH